jgi:hypothetical protein
MMSSRTRTMQVGLGLVLLLALVFGCSKASDPAPSPDDSGDGGAGGSGGKTSGTGGKTSGAGGHVSAGGGSGGTPGASGGDTGSGGTPAAGGAGGSSDEPDASTEDAGDVDASGPSGNGGTTGNGGTGGSSGPLDFGGVDQLVLVPLQHTATPVEPIIPAACPDDPTTGFTEYEDSFVVQRPYDLAAADRIKYEGGIYTFWVKSGDKTHATTSGTAPRTEARYSDMSTGELIWTGDVMFESPSKTCVFQIHNVNSPIAVYLRVIGDRMFNLSTGTTILTGSTGKWFNLKVAFNIATREVRTYINGCLKETSHAPNTASVNKWYFKHGVYTCESGTCTSHYKNIHLFQKGSTDKWNTKSTYP